MKLIEAIEELEASLTDFDLAWAIEKTIDAAREQILGEEPDEDAPEYETWEEKSEAFDELLEAAGGMSDAVDEYEDAYNDFEEIYGSAPKDFRSEEYAKWLAAFEDSPESPLDEMFCAQQLFADFKSTFDDFQDQYGYLEDLELLSEE